MSDVTLDEKDFAETLVNGLPGIFYLYDSEWRMVRWNRNHELLTGFSTDELKGKMVLDWFSPEHKASVAAAVQKVFSEGEATVEAPLSMKDGSQVPYFFKGVRLAIEGRDYFLGMGVDVSARRRSEEALRRRERQLRLVTDSLPALIAHVDSGQRYLFANQPYADWVGLPRDQIPGRHVREVLGDDAYEAIRGHVATVLSGQPVTLESVLQVGGAEPRRVLATYVPEFDGGTVRGFFASMHDVTDFEKAKEEAQAAREALYHVGRVAMLDALSSSLAHEIQQPLTGILSSAQAGEMLLEQHPLDMDEMRDIVRDIAADAKRAGEVIRRLRTYLRVHETDSVLLHINGLIEEVLRITNSEMTLSGVVVTTELGADLPQVLGDRIQLQQVLINLILNAAQAIGSSAGAARTITIRTSRSPAGQITVAVEDSGPGIEEGSFEQIFEPFYTTKSQGMGMGLAINRSILLAHGGRIRGENRSGGGARISFTLPAADARART